ncbi:methyl-accepting chemotaxis sensory transducer, class 40H, Cache_2 domain-containing [Syntrophotalea carbinolica DSM 2380]|uniref:Methyl-accepting chemotaxis sensory transducer, class 40H, Cache_2 domain-containing n=1 Tax=Syntrophotalea carbinolica (strain DSM 2380 / NBRC 103641 / GraBd1) TaxID=338963 RepID=Q3A331_SYNC1|nr:methyl-accepting chemotaxis protein [Syntrophotalea carbinolica]ABA89226.1 methyl-accepting chemotaxis sensory transducer, class 40H, Cache_2 domain-containing [Syntrophotalea carbinolica DSM 2380]
MKDLKIPAKIFLLSGSIILIFTLVASWLYLHFRNNIMEARRNEIRHVVESAVGQVEHFARLDKTGQLTTEEAQARAKAIIQDLRFANDNYFWINDMQPSMVLHPLDPELNGKSLAATEDSNGMRMFVKITEICRKNGEGFLEYAWHKEGSSKPVGKISFVKRVPQWNWVIGSGLYLDDIQKVLSKLFYTTFGILVVVIISSMTLVFFVTRGISRPLNESAEIMEKVGKGDFSLRLNLDRKDEIGRMAKALNQCISSVGEMFLNIRTMGVQIAVNTLKVSNQVDVSSRNSVEQGTLAQDIFASSQQTNAAHAEISSNTQHICASTSNNLETAQNSFQELMETNNSINSMTEKIAGYTVTIGQMDTESQDIKKIVSLIKSIATQTSLLSLNAAIEAARAGQAGKGFAIVADEVKALAEQVNAASEDIADKINNMLAHIETCINETEDISNVASATQAAVSKSCDSFKTMISDLEKSDDQLQSITASVEELSAANNEVHGKVDHINQISREVSDTMEEAKDSTEALYQITENLQRMNARYKTGKGYGEHVVGEVRKARSKIRKNMEKMLERGIDIFDRNYQPVAGTDPQKYQTAYTEAFAKELQSIYDKLVSDLKGGVFAVCVDVNGYAATHNSFCSKPCTGDPETDTVHSRHQRIFDDPSSLAAASSTAPVLLHTYKRDDGEILSEFAMPIYINGKHWGALRFGCDPEVAMDMNFVS